MTKNYLNYAKRAYLFIDPTLNVHIMNAEIYKNLCNEKQHFSDHQIITIEEMIKISKNLEMLKIGLEQFFENIFPSETSLGLLPKKIKSDGKILSFIYHPVFDASDQNPSGVMVEISDVTKEELKNSIQEMNREKNEKLLKILGQKDAFLVFLKDCESDLGQLNKIENTLLGKRILHTLKGNCSAFGLTDVAERIHEIEDDLLDQGDLFSFSGASSEISSLLDFFLTENFSTLGIQRQGLEHQSFQITDQELLDIESHLNNIENQEHKKNVLKKIYNIRLKPAYLFMSSFESTVQNLAKRLNKEIELQIEGQNIKVHPQSSGQVLRELIHILRNSCDHGIEPSDEREEKGKNPKGHILIFLKELSEDSLEILIEDDGRGIDEDKILQSAIKKGALSQEKAESLSQKEIWDLIFLDGVSTAKEISQISGRGVGMAALKERILQGKGTIVIQSNPQKGLLFRITIPKIWNTQEDALEKNDSLEIIPWNDSLKIGIHQMDEEHKMLISYINELYKIQKEPQTLSTMKEASLILNRVWQYTVYHFNSEESWLLEKKYPDLDSHKKMHEKLKQHIRVLIERFQKDGFSALTSLTNFLSHWLKSHILGTDKKYAQHILQQRIQWSESLSIHVPSMDEQHQILVNYINDFKDLTLKALSEDMTDLTPIKDLLNKLVEYTLFHFKDEESFMESIHYKGLDDHKKIHKKLLDKVNDFCQKFEVNPLEVISPLSTFLSQWLLVHIQGIDKKYGEFYQTQIQ